MVTRAYSLGRWTLLIAALSVLLLIGACGRSNIDDLNPVLDAGLVEGGRLDGGPEAGDDADAGPEPDVSLPCDVTTCPQGCCDPSGTCQAGTSLDACGIFGESCASCPAKGFKLCDPKTQACANPQTQCGPQSCKGCCEGNLCLGGADPNECGLAGQACQHCAAQGLACQPSPAGPQCAKPSCGPQNCKGCCAGDACIDGAGDTTCGLGGAACQNCQRLNEVCQFQKCVPQQSQCNAQNCANGCCVGDVCAVGTQDIDCGRGGQQCQNCTTSKQVCTNQTCVLPQPTCTPQNCPGCCDQAQACQPGFLDRQCGQLGAACANCAQQASTCDTNATPRVCKNQQTQCPSPYPACPANVTTPILPILHVCSASDLANARAACTAGATTPSCQAFMQFEQQVNPACGKCLTPLDVDFNQFSGLFECVAPFVAPDCDHSTGCVADCEDKSCALCDPASVQQCRTDARNGQCGPYFQQINCVFPAFNGAGAFCNPNNYGGNFGSWLQGVGGHYCGP